MTSETSRPTRLLLPLALGVLVALVAVPGCGGGAHHDAEAAEPAAPGTPTTPAANADRAVITITPENIETVRTVLVAADKLDGTADGIVHKCAGCALAMDGSADHALVVADHTLHFCSDSCSKRFSEHAETVLVALEVPAN